MSEPTLQLTPPQFDRLRRLIEERAGIYCPDARASVLQRALAARMHLCGATDWERYHRLLASTGDAELRQLLRYVTVSETAFFRIPSQFEALRRVLVPAITGRAPAGTLNVWSAGCSTGEEPYSIAITLAEMGTVLRPWQVHLLATDVSAAAIEHARAGRYGERALRGVPRGCRARYFVRCADGRPPGAPEHEIAPAVRRRVRFEEFNLARPRYPEPPPAGWDIIFCRNVTIYFRPQTTRQVIERFRQVLRPGGFLVLSPTECLCCISHDFEVIEVEGVFIYVKPPLQAALAGLRPSYVVAHDAPTPTHPHHAETARLRGDLPCPARSVAPPAAHEQEACSQALAAATEERWEQAEQMLLPFATEVRAPRARQLLAWVRTMRGAGEQAAALCLELLARDPLAGAAHYVLGLIARGAGELAESEEHFTRAIYSDCGLVPAHYYLGVARCARGDNEGARRAFQGALRALGEPHTAWLDFSEGLTADHWRRACDERLTAISRGD
jgi:chemotaxis protein methyltransferase CheR